MSFANTILYSRTIPPLETSNEEVYSGDDIETQLILEELEYED